MILKRKRTKVLLSLVLILTLVSLGCSLTRLSGARPSGDSAEAVPPPTRTPWPTFTPTPENVALVPPSGNEGQAPVAPSEPPTPTPTNPPPDTPTPPPPPDTPTPVPPTPTETPPLPPTNTPAPPPPTATPAPPPTPKPQYQFTPAPWYAGDQNDAMVRFYGYLKDTGGTGVDGYCVKATCGDTTVLSFPSGPSPVAPSWQSGWYDIVFPNPVSCNWTLQIVEYQCNTPGFFDAQCKEFNPVSEAIPVVTDVAAGETIIVADWIKNW